MTDEADARIAIGQGSTGDAALETDVALLEALAVTGIGVHQRKLDDTADPEAAALQLAASPLTVTTLHAPNPLRLDEPDTWLDGAYELGRSLDLAKTLGAESITIATGPAGMLPWERAADALEEALTPTLREAAREHLVVLLHHSSPLQADVGFVHSLRDLMELSWRLDTGICLDVANVWGERNLAGNLAVAADRIGAVRMADRAISSHCADDALVLGDGDLPLDRFIAQLDDAGFTGHLEIELAGARVAETDHRVALERSVAHLRALLAPPDDDDVEAIGETAPRPTR